MTITITHSLNVQSANKWNERAAGEKDVWAGRPGNLITRDVKAIQLPGNLALRDHNRLEENMSYFWGFDQILNRIPFQSLLPAGEFLEWMLSWEENKHSSKILNFFPR